MDRQLNSKSDLLKMLINNTPVAYIILDKNYRIDFMNESFCRLRNYDHDEVIG